MGFKEAMLQRNQELIDQSNRVNLGTCLIRLNNSSRWMDLKTKLTKWAGANISFWHFPVSEPFPGVIAVSIAQPIGANLLSFCNDRSVKTSPRYFRRCPYNTFLRYVGIHMRWYLQSHVVWFILPAFYSGGLLCCGLWAVDTEEAYLCSRNCQTPGVPRQSRGFTRDYYRSGNRAKPII